MVVEGLSAFGLVYSTARAGMLALVTQVRLIQFWWAPALQHSLLAWGKRYTENSMKLILSMALCCAFGPGTAIAVTGRIALLGIDDATVVIVDRNGHEIVRLSKDKRPKSALAWLPDGEHISYVVPSKEKSEPTGHLIVAAMSGSILNEVTVPSPDDGFRVDDMFTWISAHKVRIERSANPRNCGIFDLDVETMKISNRQLGACGTFTTSPDGRHVVHLGLLAITPDEDRADSVEIDSDSIVYAGEGNRVKLIAGPIWSADSQQIAFIERNLPSGELSVVVLSMAVHVQKVPLPNQLWDGSSVIVWNGTAVAVSTGGQSLLFDYMQRLTQRMTVEALSEIDHVRQARHDAEQTRAFLKKIVVQFRARDAVVSPESH